MHDVLTLDLELPKKLKPIMAKPRQRYYVAHGGRGSGKSWSFARALIAQAMAEPLRILCCREVMRTISDSVHRLLSDQIEALGVTDYFQIQETSITSATGAEFLFAGLRQQDVHKIKSFEGVDICWCEEAQTLSRRSLDILLPTIRAEQSEVWFSFNPELDTDPVYQLFVEQRPDNAWVQAINWDDNQHFPAVLDAERLRMQKADPEGYRNVWGGEPRAVVEGAIYAREVMDAIKARRIRPTPYDPNLPVHTVWDLGWNDAMTIIMVQRMPSAVMIIGYIEDSFRTYAEYVAQLKDLRYVWGTDWLPHDGESKDPKAGKSAKQVLEGLGRKVKIIPRGNVEEGIKAARMMFPRVYFDDAPTTENATGYQGVGRLVDCLKRYRRAVPTTTGEPAGPVHDEYSHGADAYRGLAMIVDQMRNDSDDRPRIPPALPRSHGRGTGI